MKTLHTSDSVWLHSFRKVMKTPAVCIAAVFSTVLLASSPLRADLGYLSIDPPMASTPVPSTDLGDSTLLLGLDGTNAVGTFNDSNETPWSFVRYGSSYVILNDPTGANSYAVVGISGNTAFGTSTDSNNVNHGFLTIDGLNFITVDVPNAQPGSTAIVGVSGLNVAGNYTDNSTNADEHGFITSDEVNYAQIDVTNSVTITNALEGSTSVAGVSGGHVVGNYTDTSTNDHGFLFDGTNYTTS
jgi:hypothetical protein